MRNVLVGGVAAAILLSGTAAPRAAQQAAVADLLRVANEYLRSYVQRASGAALDERYTLAEVGGGRSSVPTWIASEIVFINVNGRLHAMRDLTAVSGAKVRERESRIGPLLAEPTQASWDKAQQYAQNVYQYFVSELIVRMNDPVLALHFIQPPVQAKFTYETDGRKKMNGVETAGLRFAETRGERTKYVMGTRGNGYVTGRLWIDPATGAVHQSELWLESPTESARINVTYAHHAALNLWLPSKTGENYDMRPAPEGLINKGEGGYGGRFTFQANAVYSKPRHTPIDLTRMK